jgi:desulfoferrodoxin (superoxide reductase-like protein)
MQLHRRQLMKMMLAGSVAAAVTPTTLALADKAAVTITAPPGAAKGSEITVTLEITHKGNNFIHYPNWVYLKAGEKEVARWEFSAFARPETAIFTREVSLRLEETTELVAEANCNLHGSAGQAFHTVTI